jgi:hypothetical protein
MSQDDAMQIIPSQWINEAIERGKKQGELGRMTSMGVDVAQGGNDFTTIARLHGVGFASILTWKGQDTKDGASVASLILQYRTSNSPVAIDCTGAWGSSAKEHLDRQGITTISSIASARPDLTSADSLYGFGNMRAQLWWFFRDALNPKNSLNICLPDDSKLAAQLRAPTYKLKGEKIFVESKDEIRKRLGSSTDLADAVIIAWAARDVGLRMSVRQENNYIATISDPF